MSGRPLSEQEQRVIVGMVGGGHGYREIGRVLGRKGTTISEFCRRRGISSPVRWHLAEQERAAIISMFAAGHSLAEVARMMRRSPETIRLFWKRQMMDTNRKPSMPKPTVSVTVKVPTTLHDRIVAAAGHRGMMIEALIVELVGGVILHGHIGKTQRAYHDAIEPPVAALPQQPKRSTGVDAPGAAPLPA